MKHITKLQFIKKNYEKKFNKALANDDRNKVRKIIQEWQEEYERLKREV